MIQPEITTTPDYIIIRIPRFLIKKRKQEKVDVKKLRGLLKNIPEFTSKSSVEIQHLIKDLW